MNTTKKALDLGRVTQHLTAIAPELPPIPKAATITLNGGWSEEVESDGYSHYFRIIGQGEGEQVKMQSLCVQYEAEGLANELDNVDPLAPENCKVCRRIYLERKHMI
jgi:hypothetical protein